MNTIRPGARVAPVRAEQRPQDDAPKVRRFWGSMEPPKAKAEFFSAVTAPSAVDGDATVATIRMYGPIDSWGGYWGISTDDVARVLDSLPASVAEIVLRINSPGGEVHEAMAILNMFAAHRARFTAVVDGVAASAASFIAASCDETVMSPGSQMFLHSPWSFAGGNASDMRKTAEFLDKLQESMVEVYNAKAGEQDWGALLADETWLSAQDAVNLGLADRVDVVPDSGTAATVGVDDEEEVDVVVLTVPNGDDADARVRAAAARARAAAPKPPSSTEPGVPNRKENVMTYGDLKAGLAKRLGLAETDASDETLLAALDESLAEQADPNTDENENEVEVEETPAAEPVVVAEPVLANASLPEGVVAIDATVLASLQTNAQRGAEARAEQDKARREGIIAAALQTGRITSASAGDWRARLERDEEGFGAVLASLPENIVPVEEIGHASDAVASSDAYPAHWKR